MNHEKRSSSEVPESLRAQVPPPPREVIPPMPDFLIMRLGKGPRRLTYWLGAGALAAAACIGFALIPGIFVPSSPGLPADACSDIRDLSMAGWTERG